MEGQGRYITEIEYVHGVYRELGPAALNLVLLIQGIEPVALHEGFTYCDLGCGHGESANLFAACHPEGEFYGVDFNPVHIAGARGLASEAGLENVTFYEASFADLGGLGLPALDFVVMHGIWTWVDAENRGLIVEFLRRNLKPGGAVYLSYNSLPGWSAHAPLRKLLSSYADTQPGPLEERVERSIDFVQRLKAAGASVFEGSPRTAEFFDYVCTLPRKYVAHEFFNPNWTLFYHADVVRELAAAELTFAASSNLAENQDMLRFSEAQQLILDGVTDQVMRETVKDFAAAPLLRRDLFTRGRRKIAAAAQMELFSSLGLALALPQAELECKKRFPIGEVLFDRELYDPILFALELKPQSLEELLQRPEIAQLGKARVIEALIVLLAAEYVMPALEPAAESRAATGRLNRALLARQADDPGKQFLASPVLRNAIKVDWLERQLIRCQLDGDSDPLASISATMETLGDRLSRDGVVLPSGEENSAELSVEIESFRREKLPLLRHLGIL